MFVMKNSVLSLKEKNNTTSTKDIL